VNIFFKESPQVVQPPVDAVLWRYMNLDRFLTLLQKRALYFCRTDLFDDSFEGALPDKTADLMDHVRDVHARRDVAGNLAPLLSARRKYRRFFYANCWHANPYESMAMWRLYVPDGAGIALKTTVGALLGCIPNPPEGRLHSGLVSYVDYRTGLLDALGPVDTYFWKRSEYSHESEFRILYQHFPIGVFPEQALRVAEAAAEIGGSFSVPPSMMNWDLDTKRGFLLSVQISAESSTVVLPPGTTDVVARAVDMAIYASGLGLPVQRSAMDSNPRF
jgi:hypothetical protein